VPRHRLGLHRHRVGLLPVNTSAECAIQLRGQKKTGRNLRRGPVKTLSIESAGIEACLPGKYPGKSISANQVGESIRRINSDDSIPKRRSDEFIPAITAAAKIVPD